MPMSIRTVRSSVLRSDTVGSSAAASSLSSLSVAPSRSASRLKGGFEVMYTGGGELVVGAIIDEGGTGSLGAGRRCPAAAPSERVLPRVPGGQALAPSGRPWSTGTLAAPLARFLAAGSPRGKTALTPPLS